jgi:hypothetical protein
MKTPRKVNDFPQKGNHIGDLILLPSGQVYRWCEFKRWQRWLIAEQNSAGLKETFLIN